jgi:hypothetical protein
MKKELDKDDLISLVTGTDPNYSVMNYPPIKNSGSYMGGFYDNWNWETTKLMFLDEETLWDIYIKCKKSWIKSK